MEVKDGFKVDGYGNGNGDGLGSLDTYHWGDGDGVKDYMSWSEMNGMVFNVVYFGASDG